MIINLQRLLPFTMKQKKNALADKTLGMRHHDDQSPENCSEEYILVIIQASDKFVKNDQKLVTFCANSFYRRAKALPNELHVRDLE